MNTTTKRALLFLAVSLVAALAVIYVFHPDPGCGEKPSPEPEPAGQP